MQGPFDFCLVLNKNLCRLCIDKKIPSDTADASIAAATCAGKPWSQKRFGSSAALPLWQGVLVQGREMEHSGVICNFG